jgi:hypothetical protein
MNISCTHDIPAQPASGVFQCDCKEKRFVVCAHCSRVVEAMMFQRHFNLAGGYDLRCDLCRETFCLECANNFLDCKSTRCFKCRAGGNRQYVDEASTAWVIGYDCYYTDRNDRQCAMRFSHPQLFASRADAIKNCLEQIPVCLTAVVELELIERVCEELARRMETEEFREQLDQTPGFKLNYRMAVPAESSLFIAINCATLRTADGIFQ